MLLEIHIIYNYNEKGHCYHENDYKIKQFLEFTLNII